MARIKIEDLPKDQKISFREMARIHGGLTALPYRQDMSGNPGMVMYNPTEVDIQKDVDYKTGKLDYCVYNPLG
jgi:hypothetical protein